MTREEKQKALYALKKSVPFMAMTPNEYDDYIQTLNTVMDLLEQEPCEDAISRDAVIDLIADFELSMDEVVRGVHALPPVTPQIKTGHWINAYPDIEPNPMFMYGICSVCGFEQSISNKLNYCPNCGAKMVEPQESEE